MCALIFNHFLYASYSATNLHVQNIFFMNSYFPATTTEPRQYPHNMYVLDIAKLEVLYVLPKVGVNSFVRVQEHDHRRTKNEWMVVLKHNAFDNTCTIWPLLQADTCFAASSLAPSVTLPCTFNNSCFVLTLADTSQISPILVVLALFNTKPSMPCVSVI